MKKLKKFFLLSLIVANITPVVFADTNNNRFIAISFTPNISSEIKDKTLDSSDMLGVYGGIKNFISEKIGIYIGFDATVNEFANENPKLYYDYTLINAGLTFSPTKQLTFLAGVGYSWDELNEKPLIFNDSDCWNCLDESEDIKTLEENSQLNFNMEVMYEINRFGIIAGYNTAPKAYNIGISMSF